MPVLHRQASRQGKPGFTLIELLVVIAIITVLAGLLVVGIQAVTRSADKAKTSTTIGIVGTAFKRRAAESGGLGSSCAVHPLANWSAIPEFGLKRSVFVRADGVTSVALEGRALRTEDDSWVVSGQDRVLRDDDRFLGITGATPADADHPLLYGVRRDHLWIVGPAYGMMEHRRIAGPPGMPGSELDPRVHLFVQNDHGDPVAGGAQANYGNLADEDAYEEQAGRFMTWCLGTAVEELTKSGALQTTIQTPDRPLACQGRLRLLREAPVSDWEPGRLKTSLDGVTGWYRYRLRGPALYDGWGRELLCFVTSRGLTIASAGKDGVFALDPGANGRFDGPPTAPAPVTDDQDGTRDNVIEGHWGEP